VLTLIQAVIVRRLGSARRGVAFSPAGRTQLVDEPGCLDLTTADPEPHLKSLLHRNVGHAQKDESLGRARRRDVGTCKPSR